MEEIPSCIWVHEISTMKDKHIVCVQILRDAPKVSKWRSIRRLVSGVIHTLVCGTLRSIIPETSTVDREIFTLKNISREKNFVVLNFRSFVRSAKFF